MRLNLGSGDDRREGYINVDLREDVADVVASVDRLPFPDRCSEEVLALDLLEHFPVFRTADLLDEWHRVLVPGGRLVVKVPNIFELSRYIVEGRSPELLIRNIYGGHRWGPDGAYDTHHTGWTPDTLANTLTANGFRVLANHGGLNMQVEAVAI